MNQSNRIVTENKIFHYQGQKTLSDWVQTLPRPLVFTNGCFDIIHRGHVHYLQKAANLGKGLIVAINSDASVKALNKQYDRPINPLDDRLAVMAALECTDGIIPFYEDTPIEVLKTIKPDLLVKGGDWSIEDIVGAKEVKQWGGKVYSIAFEFDRSTTTLIKKIKA